MKITQESGYRIKKLTNANCLLSVGDIVSDNGSVGVTIAVNEEFYTCTVLWLKSSLDFEIKTQYNSTFARELRVKWLADIDNKV